MVRIAFKNLLARKLRLALSAFAVVLGVAFIAGTLVLTDTLGKTFDTLFGEVNKDTAVAVRGVEEFSASFDQGGEAQRKPVPQSLLATVTGVDGVARANGEVEGTAQVVGTNGKVVDTGGAPPLGESYGDGRTGGFRLVSGRAPTGPDEVAIDRGTVRQAKLTVGQPVRVVTQSGTATYTLTGLLKFGNTDNLAGASIVAFPEATAQRVMGLPGEYTQITVVADPGVSQATLRDRIKSVLPGGVEAITGKDLADESAGEVKKGLSFFNTFLLVFAVVALFVGAFIIFNTFSILVAQRSRENALLRALGASRRQVTRSVVLESVLVGVFGATVGLLLGVGVAAGLRALLDAFGISLPSGSLVFKPRTVIVSYVVGVLVTVAAAYFPGRRAAKVPPVAAMRESVLEPPGSLRRLAAAGAALLAVGVALVAAGLFGNVPFALFGLGALLSFVGVALLSPLLAPRIVGTLSAPLPRLFRTGRLGRENALRNPRRTSSTAAALMIGLALVSAFAVMAASLKTSVRDIVTGSLGSDFVIADTTTYQAFTPAVAKALDGVEGVGRVAGVETGAVQVDGTTQTVTAVPADAIGTALPLTAKLGSVESAGDGKLLVDAKTAEDKGWKVGDVVKVRFTDTGTQSLTVGATYEENQLAGKYVVSAEVFDKNFATARQLDQAVLVNVADGADAADVRKGLESALAGYPNVSVQDQSEYIQSSVDQINKLLGLIYALLLLAIVIAVIGVVNTLALSVVERTRELGLLRAVGMQRQQVKRMIRLESVVISVYGAVLGVVVGSVLGWATVRSLRDLGIKSFAYPFGTVAGVFVVAAVAGVLAAFLPARRAAKLNVLRAIASE